VSVEEVPILVEEHAALRRVAMLVARGVPQAELFAAVAEALGQLFSVEFAIMGRSEDDGTMTCVGVWGAAASRFRVGARSKLEGRNLVTIVLETGRPARVDHFEHASGPIGVIGRKSGFHSAVGTPIVVEGRLWGVMTIGSTLTKPPLPPDIEARLASFTELVATAVANAESRAGLRRLVEEQAALRRVATLVARGVPQEELFAAVTEEVGRVLVVDAASMARYESDSMMTTMAVWTRTGENTVPKGGRHRLGGRNTSTLVFETGSPARIDAYPDASDSIAADIRSTGTRSAVGAPIIVEGRLWGVIHAASTREEPLAADTATRLVSFTELVATAIANAESRAALTRLAQEQAGLRRVATLVAQDVPSEKLFAAVVEEVGCLLEVEYAYLGRYEPDGTIAVVATWGVADERFPVGTRRRLGGHNLVTIVSETGRSARIDEYAENTSGALGDIVREQGVRSGVATPIKVEGRLWGLVSIGSIETPSLPADTEARLGSFTELVATAVENAESRAELAASRARTVAAADESRRRIERDLHDGAQQRLVHSVIALKLAQRALSNGDANAGELIGEALRHAEQANSELRELAHGIMPAALTRGGLRAGVDTLVSRASLPVSVDVSVGRLPAGVEATAYFIISEALTNVVKHARAHGARVTVRAERGELRMEVRDDGIGGARSGRGSGLGGLEDRVSALGGRLVLDSPPGGGTSVCALLPVPDRD
jgi:signal transduction histidine kinase